MDMQVPSSEHSTKNQIFSKRIYREEVMKSACIILQSIKWIIEIAVCILYSATQLQASDFIKQSIKWILEITV